jgi:phosphoglycerate dehydrogenase-like enzyme
MNAGQPAGSHQFRVGISPDFQTTAAGLLEPALKEVFGPYPFIQWEFFPQTQQVTPDMIAGYDAVITLHPKFKAISFTGHESLAVIARWGVGYDMIDVPACTRANVALAITTDAVRKPVAEADVTLILALAKKLPFKDRLVRTGRWELKGQSAGLGLSGKTVGSIGLGNIASEMFKLLEPFDLGRRLAYDPYLPEEHARHLGVSLVDLPALFKESDFLTVHCPLNDETRGLVHSGLLALMKPSAFLINTARGAIVCQDDLIHALEEGQIAGAGLDVFEQEPLPTGSALIQMENVILSPHAMAWTDDLYRGNGLGACENILAILQGQIPKYVVNREVLQQPGFEAKLRSLKNRWNTFQEKSEASL